MPARRDAGLVVVVMALWAVNMGWLLGGRGQLAREHDPAGFVLFGQMLCNLGVEGFDVADHAVQEAA